MKKTSAAILSILFLASICCFSETKTSISIISTTSVKDSLPYDIFEGKTWDADPYAGYVKVDFLFDKSVKLGGVEIETGRVTTWGVTVFINVQDAVYYIIPVSNKIATEVAFNGDVQSVTVNFGRNDEISIKKIRFIDKNNNEIAISAAKSVKGSVTATSTLDPVRSYSIWGIFDSRVEYGWSSNHKKSGDVIEFKFSEPQTITAVKFWNGYQRSKVHYEANSRIKTLMLEDGRGFTQTLNFRDVMGPQEFQLSNTFKGDYLKMTILDGFTGKSYKDLVISELRFYNGNQYFLIDPIDYLKDNIKYNRGAFSTADVVNILDNNLKSVSQNEDSSIDLQIRIRSDGSIYAEGSTITADGKANKYFILGNYEVLKTSHDTGVSLRIFGYIITQLGQWVDTGGGGGGDCGGGDSGEYVYKNSSKRIFTEFLTISPLQGTGDVYYITNTGKVHNLNFNNAEFQVQ